MITIDSHQHYWQLQRFDYGWIPRDNAVLNRDYVPADLWPQMQAAGVERSVFVHASWGPEEVAWMLELSAQYPYIAGVVGSLDLLQPDIDETLARFTRHPRFKGVRVHLPAAEQDRAGMDAGLHAVVRHNLSCDILLNPAHLPQVMQTLARHPDVRFVLDHLACSRVTPGGQAAFKAALQLLAYLPNANMKLSGYLTSSQPALKSLAQTEALNMLQPYIDAALEVFGPQRLMFGSDWPVCTQQGTYAGAVSLLKSATANLSESEQSAIWSGTATRVYCL
jgi:L-fuconolactonase